MLFARCQEIQESGRLLNDLMPLAFRDGLVKWSDHQTASGRHPHCPDKAVEQDRSLHHTVAAEHPEMLAWGQDPCSVSVREQDVVEVGEQSHRHWKRRVWSRCTRQVEELDPLLVAEDLEARTQPLEALAHREAGPQAHVGS